MAEEYDLPSKSLCLLYYHIVIHIFLFLFITLHIICVPTHICGGGGFERALQEAGPELGQGLVQVESGAAVVLTQVGVEVGIQTGVLRVERAERGQRLLEGALGMTVQLSEVGWRRREGRRDRGRQIRR